MTVNAESLMPAEIADQSSASSSRIGFIDLGSNSCRLSVVQYDKRGRMGVLTRVKSMVRLGEGAFATHMLQPTAMERTLACLEEFAQIGRSYGVEKMVAVGTAALRMASNREAFIHSVEQKTGIAIEVISGEEEARLIRAGIFNALPKSKKSYLFIDIGGGSTEISISNADRIDCLESLNVGCVLVSDAVKKSKVGRISWSSFEDMMTMVEAKVSHVLGTFRKYDYVNAIASSGTALALYRLAAMEAESRNEPLKKTAEGGVLPRKAVQALAKKLAAMPIIERQKMPGMSEARAEVIVGGAAVLLALMRTFDLNEVTVTESNLQDGQRIDYQARNYPQINRDGLKTREKHVKLFAKRFHHEKAHSQQVRRLAEMLYDGAVAMSLATEDPHLKELLGYAARLHDVGIGLSYESHNCHGGYLVRYSHLLGFTDNEVETMARLVYLHSRPSSELPEYLGTQPLSQNEKVAAICLFFAEMLDKTHRSVVESVQWGQDEKRMKLVVRTSLRADIEKAGEAKMIKHFKRLLRRHLIIEFIEKC